MLVNLSPITNNENKKILLFPTVIVTIATIIIMNSGVFLDDNYRLNGITNSNRSNKAYAQTYAQPYAITANKIAIIPSSAQFSPLTNVTCNQLKVIVHYDTKDLSLLNTRINGLMQVTLSNGTLIRTSSFPNGSLIGQSGTIQFATSFTDNAIHNVKAVIILTALDKITPLSNIITINVTLNNTSTAM